MIKIPAQFTNYVLKTDGSASLRFTTSTEIGDEDNSEFFHHRGLEGWCIFAENEIQEVKIPEIDADLESKSPSQRLRNVLYVQLEQKLGRKPSNSEWTDYYRRSMEALINKIKGTLDG